MDFQEINFKILSSFFEFNRLTNVFNISPYFTYKLLYSQSILFIFIIQERNDQIKIGAVLCSGLVRCILSKQKGSESVNRGLEPELSNLLSVMYVRDRLTNCRCRYLLVLFHL